MDIIFQDKKLREAFADPRFPRLLEKNYGKQQAKLLRKRLDDLHAAETLEVMRSLTGNCHELSADRKGQLSLDLNGPYRLLFIPANNPIPQKEKGGLDWTRVTAVEILGIADTHE